LMIHNEEFIDAILIQTSDKDKLKTRFRIWMDTLDRIVGTRNDEKRIYDYSFKKRLFEDDPTCQICKQQILLIDDAEVDHINPFSKGGETSEENAQLSHRFCNRAKSNK